MCIILEVTYFGYKNEVSIRRNSFCLSASELCYYRIRAIFLRENPFLEKLFVSFLLKKEKTTYVYWSICLGCCGVVRMLLEDDTHSMGYVVALCFVVTYILR